MKVINLEKVKKNEEIYRKEHESYFINKLSTYYKNIQNWGSGQVLGAIHFMNPSLC